MSWLRRGLRAVGGALGSGVDLATGGLTDYGSMDDNITKYSPLAGMVTNQHNELASSVKEGATSAWDVLSGERDYRRDRENFLENRDYLADREDSSYIRLMEQLKLAGINPMLAGQLSPPGVNATTPPSSHSAENVRGTLGMASSLFGAGINGITGLASAQASKAGSALSLAQAGATLSKLPGDIAHTAAQTVAAQSAALASDAAAGLSKAHSAESVARIPLHAAKASEAKAHTNLLGATAENVALQRPQFAAEADFYRRYGRAGVAGQKITSPIGATFFAADRIDQATPSVRNTVVDLAGNSAKTLSDAMKRQASRVKSGSRIDTRSTPNPFMRR